MPIFSTLTESTWNSLFETKLSTVGSTKDSTDFVNIRMLKIPQYQRAYVWDEAKVTNLINSIVLSFQEDKPYYFLGNMVLCKEDKAEYGNFFIVDGQQRITTLTIIVSTIRFIARQQLFQQVEKKCDSFLEVDERERRVRLPETRFRLCIPDLDKIKYGSEFRNYIQMSKINELRSFQCKNVNHIISEYIIRLQNNSNSVYDILFQKSEEFLYNLVRYISGRCKFILMVTDQFLDAHRIFCTLNIAGEPLSALDFYRARFYGHLIKEKGLKEANRSIDAKLKIWNKIHSDLGNKEMKYFLAHIYRIKMIEKNSKDQFMASFTINDNDLLQFFSICTDDIKECDEFLNQITKFFEIWKKIFLFTEKIASKEALKLLRYSHWEIWLTIAMMAAYHEIQLDKNFWLKLEKFIAVKMVMLCSRYATADMEANELLENCYREIRWISDFKEIQLHLKEPEIEFYVQRLTSEIYTKVNDFCLVYILMRISLEMKYDIAKMNKCLDKISVDLICPMEIQPTSEWAKDEALVAYAGYLGNMMLVEKEHLDKFQGKEWSEKKTHAMLVRNLPLTGLLLAQPDWSYGFNFRDSQGFYLKTIGSMYGIETLTKYEPPLPVFNKRKFSQIADDEDVALVDVVIPATVAPENIPPPRPIVSDNDILIASSQLFEYLQQNKNRTVDGIKKALRSIDPNGTGFADSETVFRLLIRSQKQYRIFARKWQSTFRLWIKEGTMDENGCFYSGIFLTKNP